MDHVDYILDSLDMFGTVVENLIGYTFNTVTYDMNVTVETLTIMTCIFLPLAFWTGYCGMNFQPFTTVRTHNEAFFWVIICPIMVPVLAWAFYPNIIRLTHYIQKRKLQDRIRALTD